MYSFIKLGITAEINNRKIVQKEGSSSDLLHHTQGQMKVSGIAWFSDRLEFNYQHGQEIILSHYPDWPFGPPRLL